MNESVRKEIENNLRAINNDINVILSGENLSDEIIKTGFNGIRILVDYFEKLALEGESAIETI